MRISLACYTPATRCATVKLVMVALILLASLASGCQSGCSGDCPLTYTPTPGAQEVRIDQWATILADEWFSGTRCQLLTSGDVGVVPLTDNPALKEIPPQDAPVVSDRALEKLRTMCSSPTPN